MSADFDLFDSILITNTRTYIKTRRERKTMRKNNRPPSKYEDMLGTDSHAPAP